MSRPERLSTLSRKRFAAFGLAEHAYVKTVRVNEDVVYAVHAADGTYLTLFPDRETAFATVRQHDLEPVSVH